MSLFDKPTIRSSNFSLSLITGAPKLINSDLFLEKRATVPIAWIDADRDRLG